MGVDLAVVESEGRCGVFFGGIFLGLAWENEFCLGGGRNVVVNVG